MPVTCCGHTRLVDRGIDARVLAEHSVVVKSADPISPQELSRWLLTQQLAVKRDGRLEPTRRCLELAAGLRQLEGGDPHPRTWVRRRA
jgi:hypothetical protein